MHRALFKMFIGLAVALGLTFTTASVASAAPATQVQQAAAAAPECSTQGQNVTKAYNNYQAANAYVAAAKAKVKKLKKKLKKAKKHHAPAKKIKKLKKKLKKAKKAKRAGVAYRNQTIAAYNTAYGAYATCRGTNPTPPASPSLPVQALCDAVPQLQPLCTALSTVLDPLMTTFDQLCASAPAQLKPLCDALKAGMADPAGLVDILEVTLIDLGLGDAVTALQPVLDGLDSILDQLSGVLSGGLPSLPGVPALPTGGLPLSL